MAKKIEVQYFEVVVKLEDETSVEDKKGNVKTKTEKWSEKWIIHAKTSEEANRIAKSYYDGSMTRWYISSVKETAYLGVLNE